MCVLQAGQYVLTVTPPSTVPAGVTVLGNLTIDLNAGSASAATSNVSVAGPDSPYIGAAVSTHIFLKDEFGNPARFDGPKGDQNNTFLVIQDMTGGAVASVMSVAA
jgi:hypothetical protein